MTSKFSLLTGICSMLATAVGVMAYDQLKEMNDKLGTIVTTVATHSESITTLKENDTKTFAMIGTLTNKLDGMYLDRQPLYAIKEDEIKIKRVNR